MKIYQRLVTIAMTGVMAVTLSSCTDYQDEIDALDNRVAYLESLVKKLNADFESLQGIVDAFADGDYITNITETSEGYIINFNNNDPIMIHDGKDGKDAQMPDITVEQDPTDGNFYWKLNGQWLTDPYGSRIRANGTNGKDGKDGKDGVSPRVRINENGIWEVSYDGGVTWISTGTSATGKDGKDGQDANAIVRIVTHWNEGYVEFITNSGSFILPLKTV